MNYKSFSEAVIRLVEENNTGSMNPDEFSDKLEELIKQLPKKFVSNIQERVWNERVENKQ